MTANPTTKVLTKALDAGILASFLNGLPHEQKQLFLGQIGLEMKVNADGQIEGGEDMPTPPRLAESLEWDKIQKTLGLLENAKSEHAQKILGQIVEKLIFSAK